MSCFGNARRSFATDLLNRRIVTYAMSEEFVRGAAADIQEEILCASLEGKLE